MTDSTAGTGRRGPQTYGGLAADQVISRTGALAVFLGGSEDSFTGILLYLTSKADPGNRARLRSAFPRQVRAWETWMSTVPAPTAAQLAALLAVPDPAPGAVTPETEQAQVDYVAQLMTLEQAGERTPVLIGPFSLITTIGALQLVLRRPDVGNTVRSVLTQLIDAWRAPFDNTPGEVIIDQGFNPEFDGDGKHPRSDRV